MRKVFELFYDNSKIKTFLNNSYTTEFFSCEKIRRSIKQPLRPVTVALIS